MKLKAPRNEVTAVKHRERNECVELPIMTTGPSYRQTGDKAVIKHRHDGVEGHTS